MAGPSWRLEVIAADFECCGNRQHPCSTKLTTCTALTETPHSGIHWHSCYLAAGTCTTMHPAQDTYQREVRCMLQSDVRFSNQSIATAGNRETGTPRQRLHCCRLRVHAQIHHELQLRIRRNLLTSRAPIPHKESGTSARSQASKRAILVPDTQQPPKNLHNPAHL